jgi:hypothetical protein
MWWLQRTYAERLEEGQRLIEEYKAAVEVARIDVSDDVG